MDKEIREILRENDKRNAELKSIFDPLTGEGSLGDRVKLVIPDFMLPVQWVPREMLEEPFVKTLLKCKSIKNYISKHLMPEVDGEELVAKILLKIRSKYDFPFWAIMFVRIKNKMGGEDISFKLNRPQRKLVEVFERQRLAHQPIRVILVKARQWGGSTVTQMYMAWIQLVHKKSWNSTIASHTNQVSATVRGMFSKMIDNYPAWMLYPIAADINEKEPKMTSFEGQQGIQYVPSRQCKIRIATANAQENLRSEDVAMAHCTEVALWPDTMLLHPEDFVDACMAGMGQRELTMQVLESTAKGSGNYFHSEWVDAKKGISGHVPVFVSWREIEHDSIPFNTEEQKIEFAKFLLDNKDEREAKDRRSESGSYLWHQWEEGATLEGLLWYVTERRGKLSSEHMYAEAPSNDIEAFKATGEDLFDMDIVERLRKGCKQPKWIGEVQGAGAKGDALMKNVHFVEDRKGELAVWVKPETFEDSICKNRYICTVDIGGTSHAADWSVIMVLDRYWLMEGGKPSVVAQWRGHIDHDLLAWKAAQIAKWYDDALLVIESNTLDKERDMNADLSEFILNRVKKVYDNLYERARSEEDIKNGLPVRYGWHTNRNTKPAIIKNLQEVVRDQLYVERDEGCLDEMLTYEHNDNRYEAKQGEHDDRLMTRAIALWISNEMEIPRLVPIKAKMANNYQHQQGLL